MKKKIIILLSLLLLTGCTVNYNLEINKDTLNETITGTVTKEESSQDSNATGFTTRKKIPILPGNYCAKQ